MLLNANADNYMLPLLVLAWFRFSQNTT